MSKRPSKREQVRQPEEIPHKDQFLFREGNHDPIRLYNTDDRKRVPYCPACEACPEKVNPGEVVTMWHHDACLDKRKQAIAAAGRLPTKRERQEMLLWRLGNCEPVHVYSLTTGREHLVFCPTCGEAPPKPQEGKDVVIWEHYACFEQRVAPKLLAITAAYSPLIQAMAFSQAIREVAASHQRITDEIIREIVAEKAEEAEVMHGLMR